MIAEKNEILGVLIFFNFVDVEGAQHTATRCYHTGTTRFQPSSISFSPAQDYTAQDENVAKITGEDVIRPRLIDQHPSIEDWS